jgi:putative membrane protein
MYHGYAYGSGNHWGLWVLMIVAMVVFWGALAWIIVTLVRHRAVPVVSAHPVPESPAPPTHGEAVRILNERFARGDIDEEEYSRRRALIEGSR